jgi:hypothetical protein
MDRRSILCDLVELPRPVILDAILLDLKRLLWDSEVPLVMLEQQHLASALRRYRNNELSSGEIEIWANAIEARDDISYEPSCAAGRLRMNSQTRALPCR